MNANYFTAPWTSPSFFFVSDKMSNTELPYVHEVVNHAHAIICSIAFIQMIQLSTREAVTIEAELNVIFRYLFTIFNFACNASF